MEDVELPPSLRMSTIVQRPELQAPTVEAEPEVDEDARFEADRPRLRYIGICFLLQFLAFFTMQSLVTSLFPDYGAISVAAIYFGYASSCLIGPMVVQKFGERSVCPPTTCCPSCVAHPLFLCMNPLDLPLP
jgi:hypothetical protein